MAQIRLKLKGEAGNITVRNFSNMLASSVAVLNDLDAAISRTNSVTLDWVVADLHVGSLEVLMQSNSRVEDINVGPEVSRNFITALSLIEHERVTPPYLTEVGMAHARKLIKLVGKGGTESLEVEYLDQRTDVTARAVINIDQLLAVRYKSLGSIEGRLETISIHRTVRHPKPGFVIYHHRTNKAVTCRFDENLLDTVKGALGQRVNVWGMISSNARGEPLKVEVQEIRLLSSGYNANNKDLGGSDPNFSGELKTEEYIRRMRLG